MHMSVEGGRARAVESKEVPSYNLTVAVYRHGPKETQTGPLSGSGKEYVRTAFDEAYADLAAVDEETGGTDVIYSPIHRTRETAEIVAEGILRRGGLVKSVTPEERLNEGMISRYEDELKEKLGGGAGRWLKGWMKLEERPKPDVKTGKESAADVADWLLELVRRRRTNGGAQDVEAFSHYPVIAGFLMRLEEITGQHILPDNWMELPPARVHLDFLKSFVFHVDNEMDGKFIIVFHGKKTIVLLSALEEMISSVREDAAAAK